MAVLNFPTSKKIKSAGFSSLPSGFLKNGNGFPSSGYLVLRNLKEKLEAFSLLVSKDQKSSLVKLTNSYAVTINHADLRTILRRLRELKSREYRLRRDAVLTFLNRRYPRQFKAGEGESAKYQANELANLLEKEGIAKNLSREDAEKLIGFYPKLFRLYSDELKGTNKLFEISKSKKFTEIIYLENIVKEYAKKLKAQTQSESVWQEFLRDYILMFNTNYTSILEKESISIPGKYPDFLLIDVYNYLDVYKIKKPNTNLLKSDDSRGNYYWDTELSKAISQVENYIHYMNKNSALLREEIKRRKGVDIRVVKPRGFVIAGQRSQLKNEIMEDNFRLLNNSMKNIEVVLYDELLDNLKNFLTRLKRSK